MTTTVQPEDFTGTTLDEFKEWFLGRSKSYLAENPQPTPAVWDSTILGLYSDYSYFLKKIDDVDFNPMVFICGLVDKAKLIPGKTS